METAASSGVSEEPPAQASAAPDPPEEREGETWRESLQALLKEYDIEEVEDGVLELLFSAACNEAAILLNMSKKAKQGAMPPPEPQAQAQQPSAAAPSAVPSGPPVITLTSADVRLAATLKQGRAPDHQEAKRRRDTRNEQPMPSVQSSDDLELPLECLLTGQDYSVEPIKKPVSIQVKAARNFLRSKKAIRDQVRARTSAQKRAKRSRRTGKNRPQ
mmetsp:Transcript_99463/g.207138  ORF Transcript_99463/g.207138 Transcript_99463/m.207138 type:complete len:217 (-) Transcript_99463:354-1004(-)